MLSAEQKWIVSCIQYPLVLESREDNDDYYFSRLNPVMNNFIQKGLSLLSKHKQNTIFQQMKSSGFRASTWSTESILFVCRCGFRDVRNACHWHKDYHAYLTGIVFLPTRQQKQDGTPRTIYGTQFKHLTHQTLQKVSPNRLYLHGPVEHRTPSMTVYYRCAVFLFDDFTCGRRDGDVSIELCTCVATMGFSRTG